MSDPVSRIAQLVIEHRQETCDWFSAPVPCKPREWDYPILYVPDWTEELTKFKQEFDRFFGRKPC